MNSIPSCGNYFQSEYVDRRVPSDIIIKIFLNLFEQEPRSLKDLGAFALTCKRVNQYFKREEIWRVVIKSLPLREYSDSGNTYSLCKAYKNTMRNVVNGKYDIYSEGFLVDMSNNSLTIKVKSEEYYICNMFNHHSYLLDKEFLREHYFNQFIVKVEDNKIHVLNRSSGKKITINMKNQCITGTHQLGKAEIHLGNKPIYVGDKYVLTLEQQDNHKTCMNIWNLETGERDRKKSCEDVIDNTKKAIVNISGEGMPCFRHRGDNNDMQIVIYDIEMGKSYAHTATNISEFFKNWDEMDLIPHVINDHYMVYCGTDNAITFINRKAGKEIYVDLKDEETKEHIIALNSFKEDGKESEVQSFSNKAHLWENTFLYYDSESGSIRTWNLITNNDMAIMNCEYTLKHNHSQVFACFGNTIVISDTKENSDELVEIFLNLQLEEQFTQTKCSLPIDHHHRFIDIVDVGDDWPIGLIYHDAKPGESIALTLPEGACVDADTNALWEHFLAIKGQSKDEESRVFIFDVTTGKCLVEIPLSSPDYSIALLEWLNGCLYVKGEGNESYPYFISFQDASLFSFKKRKDPEPVKIEEIKEGEDNVPSAPSVEGSEMRIIKKRKK